MQVRGGRQWVKGPKPDEVETDITLGEWVVRQYSNRRYSYHLLYHYHPKGFDYTIITDRFDKPPPQQETLGLVSSSVGISDKAVGHAKCVVCHTVAPAEALGFLEMCKWQR